MHDKYLCHIYACKYNIFSCKLTSAAGISAAQIFVHLHHYHFGIHLLMTNSMLANKIRRQGTANKLTQAGNSKCSNTYKCQKHQLMSCQISADVGLGWQVSGVCTQPESLPVTKIDLLPNQCSAACCPSSQLARLTVTSSAAPSELQALAISSPSGMASHSQLACESNLSAQLSSANITSGSGGASSGLLEDWLP
jgi:hypothetical protein